MDKNYFKPNLFQLTLNNKLDGSCTVRRTSEQDEPLTLEVISLGDSNESVVINFVVENNEVYIRLHYSPSVSQSFEERMDLMVRSSLIID